MQAPLVVLCISIPFSCKTEIQPYKKVMEYSNEEKLEWTVIFIHEFSQRFGLTMKQAFGYLSRFKAIDFIDRHYGFVHTQPFDGMVNDIATYCKKNGGKLL